MNGKVHGGFAVFVFVSFLIGLITFLLGCNPNLKNQCIAYDTVQGTAYDYKFVTETCKKCASRTKRSCNRYTYYPCYSSYVKFHYGSNSTCLLQTENESTSASAAQNSAHRYDIGDKKTMIKMKGGNDCSEMSTGLITWGAGVAFLSMCALAIFVWLGFAVFEFSANVSNGVPVTSSFNNMAKVASMAVMSPVAVAEPIGGGYGGYGGGYEMY